MTGTSTADFAAANLGDPADLRALPTYIDSDPCKEDPGGIGGVSSQSIGVLLRSPAELEDGGGNEFFADRTRTAPDGRGVISQLGTGEAAVTRLLAPRSSMTAAAKPTGDALTDFLGSREG